MIYDFWFPEVQPPTPYDLPIAIVSFVLAVVVLNWVV